MSAIRSRLREPSTWLALGFIFYVWSGGTLHDADAVMAWVQQHKDWLASAAGAAGVLLGERGGAR